MVFVGSRARRCRGCLKGPCECSSDRLASRKASVSLVTAIAVVVVVVVVVVVEEEGGGCKDDDNDMRANFAAIRYSGY